MSKKTFELSPYALEQLQDLVKNGIWIRTENQVIEDAIATLHYSQVRVGMFWRMRSMYDRHPDAFDKPAVGG